MANATLSLKERNDLMDTANELATKLAALLAPTYGQAGPEFRNLNDETQDEYLWTCADLASELKAVIRKF